MSILKVNTITGIIDMPKNVRIKGGLLGVNFTVDSLGALPDSTSGDSFLPSAGDWFWDSGNETLKLYLNDSHGWKNIGLTDSSGVSGAPPAGDYYGDIAVLAGGGNPNTITIEYWNISTAGNAANFGNTTATSNHFGSAVTGDAGTRAVVWNDTVNGSRPASVEYFTISTLGNATSAGNIGHQTTGSSGTSNGTRGVFHFGNDWEVYNNPVTNKMEYLTLASLGSAATFGNLTQSKGSGGRGTVSNGTRGIFTGGNLDNVNYSNRIEYITIDTTGNASVFGTLSGSKSNTAQSCDLTYGVIGGGFVQGSGRTDTIEYITIDTTGNTTDFGDLTLNRYQGAGAGNSERVTFSGGNYYNSGPDQGPSDIIEYIVVSTPGNATDFGDLTSTRTNGSITSGT